MPLNKYLNNKQLTSFGGRGAHFFYFFSYGDGGWWIGTLNLHKSDTKYCHTESTESTESKVLLLPTPSLGIPKGDALTSGTQEGEDSPYRSPLPCRGGAGGGVSNFKNRVGIFLTPPPTPPLIGVGRTAENTATQLPTPIRGGVGGGVKGLGK